MTGRHGERVQVRDEFPGFVNLNSIVFSEGDAFDTGQEIFFETTFDEFPDCFLALSHNDHIDAGIGKQCIGRRE